MLQWVAGEGRRHAVTRVGWAFMELWDRSQLPVVPLWHSTVEDKHRQRDDAATQQALRETLSRQLTPRSPSDLAGRSHHIIFKQIFCHQTFKVSFKTYLGWKKCQQASEPNLSVHLRCISPFSLHTASPQTSQCPMLTLVHSWKHPKWDIWVSEGDGRVCACVCVCASPQEEMVEDRMMLWTIVSWETLVPATHLDVNLRCPDRCD